MSTSPHLISHQRFIHLLLPFPPGLWSWRRRENSLKTIEEGFPDLDGTQMLARYTWFGHR